MIDSNVKRNNDGRGNHWMNLINSWLEGGSYDASLAWATLLLPSPFD